MDFFEFDEGGTEQYKDQKRGGNGSEGGGGEGGETNSQEQNNHVHLQTISKSLLS